MLKFTILNLQDKFSIKTYENVQDFMSVDC